VVKGLDLFRRHFAGHSSQYVLIGGTAASLALENAGLEFRATKDLDIVLHVEALDAAFGTAFWAFVEQGRYQIRQSTGSGRPLLYRFAKPGDDRFPAMLELFSRAPIGFTVATGSHLTPIPLTEAVASLSAILLDEDYYGFITSGRRESDGLPWVGEDRLIPLKASAWLDLTARQARGEAVDSKDVRKHMTDVIRLSQLLTPDLRIPLAARIRGDLNRFLDALASDHSLDPKALKIRATVQEIIGRIAQAYALGRP
jgi:hypothetical protein